MGFRLTHLPTAIRDHGVDVVELAGWQGRGIEFPRAPLGGIDHWTVGAPTGELPSAAILTYGRSDLLGPLCNVARGRRVGNRRARAFMVASGKANHAGRGRLSTSRGVADSNYDLFGLEVEYRPWSEPIRDEDLDVDARIHAAAAQVCGYTPDDVVGHWEYATPAGRKVDRNTVSAPLLRALIRNTTNRTPDLEDDMATVLAHFRTIKGSEENRHTYRVSGNVASWCGTQEEIRSAEFFGATWFGPLDPPLWQSLAVINGPLANQTRGVPAP